MKRNIVIVLSIAALLLFGFLFVGKSEEELKGIVADMSPGGIQKNRDCVSDPDPVFTNHFTDLSKIGAIGIMGGYGGGSPGRSYVGIKRGMEVPVYAPMDATLETIVYAPRGSGTPPEYGFYFRASCEVTFLLDHVDKVSDEIRKFAPEKPAASTRTELGSRPNAAIKAGTLLGYSDGTPLAGTFDFLVMNTGKPAFHINEKRWEWDQALYASCPYDYYEPGLKAEHYAKLGTINDDGFMAENSCGSPSQDVPGTISGGWFKGDSTDMKGDFLGIGQTSYLTQIVIRKDGNITYRLDDYSFSSSALSGGKKKRPTEVKAGDEVCYTGSQGWIYAKLISDAKLSLARGEGVCPAGFPQNQAEAWQR